MLEITESMLIEDPEIAVVKLQELRALGMRIAMDDFGTGYSSLSYLSRFPVDVIKMDRSFLRARASPEAVDLSSAVVALGSSLALEVVAEGIELDEQLSACATSAASSARASTSRTRWRRGTCSTTCPGGQSATGRSPVEAVPTPAPAPADGV